jgi:hypothetical protein
VTNWIPQPSFGKGEVSPSLYGRIDLSSYSIGAKIIENFLVARSGGLVNTPGTQFIGEVKDSSKRTRLIPFSFNTEQTYILEFGDLYMRVIKDGGYVLDDSDVVYEIVTPFLEAELSLLKYMQSADVMTINHRSHPQSELTRTGHAAWTLTVPSFTPVVTPPAISSAVFNTGETGQTYQYEATSVAVDTAEESLPSSAISGTGPTDANWNAGEWMTLTGTAPSGVDKINIYKNDNGIYGFVGQAAVSAGAWTFNDIKINPDPLDAPQEQKFPFDGAGKYPQCSTYYEQRSMYGGSLNRPQGFDMSQSGQYHNFNMSTPLKDDDAISRNIAALQVNEIRHFVPLRDLLILTSGGIWTLSAGGNSDVITPSSISVRIQSSLGVSHVPPITINDAVIVVQDKGSIVRDLGYSFQSDNYVGSDLSIISSHIFEGNAITEWAYASVPYSIVYAVMSNGIMATMTYMREQELIAWTRQVTDGLYESVASISEGSEDAVYVIVNRTINGEQKRYVERFASRIVNDPADAFFVHCGLTYVGEPVSHLTGLDHLEGCEVVILCDGNVLPRQTVTDGGVSLPVSGSKISIGLPYTSELESLPIGDTQGGIGKRKKTVKLRARVERSRGMWVGPTRSDSDMTELKRDEFWSNNLKTEEIEILTVPDNTEVATVIVQQRDPLPLSILALIPEVDG